MARWAQPASGPFLLSRQLQRSPDAYPIIGFESSSHGGLLPAQNVAQDAKPDQDASQQGRNHLQILPNVQSQFPEIVVLPHVVQSTVFLVAAMSKPSDEG
jgi:hypothetical protein